MGPTAITALKVCSHSVLFCRELIALVESSWTQGFFPGLLWLLVERIRLDPTSVDPHYSEEKLIQLARRWQADFEWTKRPALNHDQGFRFQLSYGKCVPVHAGAHLADKEETTS